MMEIEKHPGSVLFEDEVSTGSGPGSPRGQPAWGGGCDRVTILAILILAISRDPVATAPGTDSMTIVPQIKTLPAVARPDPPNHTRSHETREEQTSIHFVWVVFRASTLSVNQFPSFSGPHRSASRPTISTGSP